MKYEKKLRIWPIHRGNEQIMFLRKHRHECTRQRLSIHFVRKAQSTKRNCRQKWMDPGEQYVNKYRI